jgi:hypothetical protein
VNHRLFNALAVMSLLLCVATAAIWVRSHFASDTILYCTGPAGIDKSVWVQWGDGDIRIGWQSAYIERGFQYWREKPWKRSVWRGPGEPYLLQILGFEITYNGRNGNGAIYIPCWMGFFCAALPLALRYRHHRKVAAGNEMGLCVNCGYDLRATPDRCPECGAIPPTMI